MIKQQAGVVESRTKVSDRRAEKTLLQLIGDRLRKQSRVPSRYDYRAPSQSHLIEMIEATSDFIVTMDSQGHVLYCNRAVRQILGMTADEDRAPLHITNIYTARSCATVLGEGVFVANQDGQWSGEAALRTQAGREIPVSQVIIAPFEPDRRSKFVALIARDVQEIKHVEEILRKSEHFYRQIAESARIGIWVIDRQHQTIFVNPKMAHLLGYQVDEMLGKPSSDFFFSPTLSQPYELEKANNQTLRRKDGEALWVNLSSSPFFNEQEQDAGTLMMVNEGVESRRTQMQA